MMMKKIALVLLVAAVLAMGVAGVMAASQFASTQEWSIYTAGGAWVVGYNYTTTAMDWYDLTAADSTEIINYNTPNPGDWMGFWTYDNTAAVYTEGVYILIEAF